MDLTYHPEESMCIPKNSLVIVHQNIRGIISEIKVQEFFSNDKIYPPILCFFEHHMSRDDVHFMVIGSSYSWSTFQKGSVCMYICNDVSFILIFLNIAKKQFWKYVQHKLQL